ncbi:MAG: hypothetical protein HYW79_02015 [Parcubacteria group bacterium]|nr:hypothetical protein [Parcubacteria group bacterium]
MANTFFSKKIIISAAIILGGLFIAADVLVSANFSAVKLSAVPDSPQWTQETRAGVSVPACLSSSASSPTCVGETARATISWTNSNSNHAVNLDVCKNYWCDSIVYTPSGMYNSAGWDWFTLPASGSVTLDPLDSNTTYIYALRDGSSVISNRSFITPNCAPANYTLSVNSSGASSVAITGSPSTYGGTTNYTKTVTDGTSLSLTAPATKGSADFSSWSGCNSVSGSGNRTCNVTMTANKTVTAGYISIPGSFNLSQGSIACNSVGLTWTASSGADAYRILRGSARVDISPYQPYIALNFTDTTVSQNTSYLYQIEAYNSAGTRRSNSLNVDTPSCPPTLNFSANPTSIFQGQSSILKWDSTYTTSCNASSNPTQSDWNGPKALNNSVGQTVIPSPPPSVTYTLTCTGPGGSIPKSVVITISPLALPEFREIIPR